MTSAAVAGGAKVGSDGGDSVNCGVGSEVGLVAGPATVGVTSKRGACGEVITVGEGTSARIASIPVATGAQPASRIPARIRS